MVHGWDTGAVPDQFDPVPQRIGDAERDRAAEYLREHLASGRLDQDEFDERVSRALTARTAADLDPLFVDLPSPKPGSAVEPASSYLAPPWQTRTPGESSEVAPAASASVPARYDAGWAVISALAWAAAVIFCMATGWEHWWVIMIPVFLPWWIRRAGSHGNHHRP
ncbi:MAG: hypothetical protein JWN06_3546 [Propionibacteriaceae bacterium]|nr:hypothetical protein [Propionibacteriaceae bacterium]